MQQIALIPEKGPHVEPVTAELIARIRRRPTLLRAIHLAIELSELEAKRIYGRSGMDKAAYSRMCDGKAWLPQDERFIRFCETLQTDIPLIWLAEARGYDWTTIRKRHSSDLERENSELKQKVADQDRAISLLISHHQGRK